MATPAYVKYAIDNSYGTTSTRNLDVKSTIDAGSLVVVGIATESSSTITEVKDTGGVNPAFTVYQQTPGNSSSNPGYVALAYLRLTSSLTTAHDIRVTFSGNCAAIIGAVVFTGLSDVRTGQNTIHATSSSQSVSVTPGTGLSGYAIGIMGTWNAYDRGTSALANTTRLIGINPTCAATNSCAVGVQTFPTPEPLNTSAGMQMEVFWRPSSRTTATTIGVSISAASINYHGAAIMLPEISNFSSPPQVIAMF